MLQKCQSSTDLNSALPFLIHLPGLAPCAGQYPPLLLSWLIQQMKNMSLTGSSGWPAAGNGDTWKEPGPKLELWSTNGGWRNLCPLCFSWCSNLCQPPLASPKLFPSSHNSLWRILFPQLRRGTSPELLWGRASPPSQVNEDFLWEMRHKQCTQSQKSAKKLCWDWECNLISVCFSWKNLSLFLHSYSYSTHLRALLEARQPK